MSTNEATNNLENAIRAVYDALGEDRAEQALNCFNPLFVASHVSAEETAGRVAEALDFLSDAVMNDNLVAPNGGLAWLLMAAGYALDASVAHANARREQRKVVAIGSQP